MDVDKQMFLISSCINAPPPREIIFNREFVHKLVIYSFSIWRNFVSPKDLKICVIGILYCCSIS